MRPTAVMAAALLAGAIPAGAQSLGAAKGTVFIGRPLDVVVASAVESDDAAALCAEARVRYGETSLAASDVALSVVRDDPRGPGLRVRTRTPVDEPFVIIDVKVGCSTPFTRRYTLLPSYSEERQGGDQPVQGQGETPSNQRSQGAELTAAGSTTTGGAPAAYSSVHSSRGLVQRSRPGSPRLERAVSKTGIQVASSGWAGRYAFSVSDAHVTSQSNGGRLTVEPLGFESDEAFLKFLLARLQPDQESSSDSDVQQLGSQEREQELENLRRELADLRSRQQQAVQPQSPELAGYTEAELLVAFGVGTLLAGLAGWLVNRRKPGLFTRSMASSDGSLDSRLSEKALWGANRSSVHDRLKGWFARVAWLRSAGRWSSHLDNSSVRDATVDGVSVLPHLSESEISPSHQVANTQESVSSGSEVKAKDVDLDVAEASDWLTAAHVDARSGVPSPVDMGGDATSRPNGVALDPRSKTGYVDVADAHDSAFEPAPVAALDLAALHELWERVDFFEDLGQIADAVAALRSFVLAHPRASEAPYLRWWRLASEHGLDARLAQATYEQHYHRLLQGDGRRGTLLDDEALLQRLQAEWPGQQARATVEQALASQPDAKGQALLAVRSLAAFDDLITLHGVLDLLPLLPMAEADPAAPPAAPKSDDHVIEFDLSGWTLPPAPPPAATR